jgi:hypothetical protein
MEETKSVSITSLITIPALITLIIIMLRLVGEIEQWPKPWFNVAASFHGWEHAPRWRGRAALGWAWRREFRDSSFSSN